MEEQKIVKAHSTWLWKGDDMKLTHIKLFSLHIWRKPVSTTGLYVYVSSMYFWAARILIYSPVIDSIAASRFVLNWLSWQTVSVDKIQITILILRRGALSTLEQSKKSRNLFHNQIEGLNARTTVPQKYDFLSVALPVSQFLPNDFEGIMLLLPLLTS